MELPQIPESDDPLRCAMELTLLFYSVGQWDTHRLLAWDNRLSTIYYPARVPNAGATTKVMCDAIRYALAKQP